MKKLVLGSWHLLAMAGAMFLISCNKQQLPPREDLEINEELAISEDLAMREAAGLKQFGDISAVTPFNKNVGAPIDGRLGAEWIKNYVKKNGKAKSYTLKTAYLQNILKKPNCVGICMYYARDFQNNIHILPVGVDLNGKVIPGILIPTEKSFVLWYMAKNWIFKYSGAVAGHFFGANSAFPRLKLNTCGTVRVDFALDGYGKPQLLLSNPCEKNFAKMYEDRSFPCNTESPIILL